MKMSAKELEFLKRLRIVLIENKPETVDRCKSCGKFIMKGSECADCFDTAH